MKSRLIARWKSAGWNEFVFLSSALGLCLCVWLFLVVARVVEHGRHAEIEERLMRSLRNPDNLAQPIGPWWLAELGRDISAVGSAGILIVLSLLVIGYLLLREQWSRVALVVVAIAGGYLLSNTLKVIYGRERPDVVPHLSEVTSASFPSGHSMSSSVAYLTMGALLAQSAKRRREKIYFIAAALGLTFLIGLSRVFLGVHYPTDVIAGWSVGIAWALGCFLIASRLQKPGQPSERGTL